MIHIPFPFRGNPANIVFTFFNKFSYPNFFFNIFFPFLGQVLFQLYFQQEGHDNPNPRHALLDNPSWSKNEGKYL